MMDHHFVNLNVVKHLETYTDWVDKISHSL